ncbi:radical SAM protein [Streptomyces sp. NPDC059009]|uniref:radical SAM protein n=1 Tax=Streptomyces sp. NPDC059009 TaxID=3346694 RepID=UPI003690A500
MPPTPQPARDAPFLPKSWLQRYDSVRLTRDSDGAVLDLPVGSSILSFLDYNPRWFVDRLVESHGRTLFTLGLDMTNSCTDACPMCFTMAKRKADGLNLHLDVDLTLRRMAELRAAYPDTFRLVMMSGSGEPLNLPGVEELLDGVADLGLAIRVYTAGKKLNKERVRRAVLRSAVAVRLSVDAVDEETFRTVHAAEGLDERLDSIRALVEERDRSGATTLIGAHFVIQRDNWRQIVPFAEQTRRLGCDYVSYSQETYGHVAGGFTRAEFQRMIADLNAVEQLHDDDFGVMVPRLTARPTVLAFDKDFTADERVLDGCHHSRQHIFFGVRNDFSACCLAGMDADFARESRLGPLADDRTMTGVRAVVEQGVGSALGRPAKLSCNSCMMNGYNTVLDKIFHFLDGETSWDCGLLPYVPGRSRATDYELVMKGVEEQERLAARTGTAERPPTLLPVVNAD